MTGKGKRLTNGQSENRIYRINSTASTLEGIERKNILLKFNMPNTGTQGYAIWDGKNQIRTLTGNDTWNEQIITNNGENFAFIEQVFESPPKLIVTRG